ncbi:MAG: hypothetical protein OEV40_27070 [Acidimicrobiia bacterium]|nr:hypothetical protein [Acidimicrobiia bacterium]
MTLDDRFSALKPHDIIATIASVDQRYRSAFRSHQGATADDLSDLRTANGSILDEVATTVVALATARTALTSAADGGFPEVPAAVLGLEPFPVVATEGTVDHHLRELGAEVALLVATLKAIPRERWGRAAHADDRIGHATIEQIGQQAARYAIAALHRIEVATGDRPP